MRSIEKELLEERKKLAAGLVIGIFVVLMIVVSHFILKKPLQMDLGITLVIFSLSSMVTLSYVDKINRLKKNANEMEEEVSRLEERHPGLTSYIGKIRRQEIERTIQEISKAKDKTCRIILILSWACVFFFITIVALLVRIFLLIPHSPLPPLFAFLTTGSNPSLTAVPASVDSVIIVSFTMSSCLRVIVFVYSYYKYFWPYESSFHSPQRLPANRKRN